jgi:hypothetical protein
VINVQVLIFINEEHLLRMWFFSGTGFRHFLAVDNVSFMISVVIALLSFLCSQSQFVWLSLIVSPVVILLSKLQQKMITSVISYKKKMLGMCTS